MTSLTSKETIEAKRSFERFAEQHGVRIEHYHCDNGRFADNDFKADVPTATHLLRHKCSLPEWDCREGYP